MSILHTLQDIKMNVINCNESILSLTARKQFLSNYIGTNFVFVFLHYIDINRNVQQPFRGHIEAMLGENYIEKLLKLVSLLLVY